MTIDDLHYTEREFERCSREILSKCRDLNRESQAALLKENARLRELADNLRAIAWYQRRVGMSSDMVELFYNTLVAMNSKLCSSQNKRFHCGACLECKPYTINGRTYGGYREADQKGDERG